MNKRIKKLVLSRETLLNLSGKHLEGVHGGVTAGRCSGACNSAYVESDCNTCEGSCMSCWCSGGSGCAPTQAC